MYLRHFIWKALILCLRAQIYNPSCKAAASWQKWQENSHWFKVYQKYTPLHRSRWLENALNRGFNGNSSYTWRIVTCSMWLPEGSDWDLSILMCWKNPITNYLIHECDCNIYLTAYVSETLLIIMSSRMMFLKMPGLKAAGGSYWNPCLTWNPNQTGSKILIYNESTYKIIQVYIKNKYKHKIMLNPLSGTPCRDPGFKFPSCWWIHIGDGLKLPTNHAEIHRGWINVPPTNTNFPSRPDLAAQSTRWWLYMHTFIYICTWFIITSCFIKPPD